MKLFTHTDLDGIGCYLVLQAFDPDAKIQVSYCNYDEIDNKVMNYITDNPHKDIPIYITDISVNEETAEHLDALYASGYTIHLIDHHATAEWLNKYNWANVCKTR